LYLLAGTPTPNLFGSFAATLARVDAGAVTRTVELASREAGIEWIGISYELRAAVVLPQGDGPVVIVDLDKGTVAKQCIPTSGTGWLLNQWLANVPGKGPIFQTYLAQSAGDAIVRGLLLDPSVPCDESYRPSFPADIRYASAHGMSGVGDVTSRDSFIASVDDSGRIIFNPRSPIYLDVDELPVALRKKGQGGIMVNNSQAVLFFLGNDEPGRGLVYRRRRRTWRPVLFPTDVCNCREFGKFIAITETRHKRALMEQMREHPGVVYADAVMAAGEQSPGSSEWRQAATDYGPNQDENFAHSLNVFPGRLHLYNIETERVFTIETKQGDSEILLVENNAVYYRVSDRLYSAPITDKGIGTAKLIATDDIIRDSHWAFIKH
jgi:hypothetical protein